MKHNFSISKSGIISEKFLERGITDFFGACSLITLLPYKRNSNKEDLSTVFSDGYGTCSTKHALLKQLAIENNRHEVKLILCLLKMKGTNTPAVKNTLEKHGLAFIPEAHNYLVIKGHRIDCTKEHFGTNDSSDILEELEIEPHQITDFKVAYHQKFLKNWLKENSGVKISFEELWSIREQCIKDLYSV